MKNTAPALPVLASTFEPWGPPSTVPECLRFNDVPYAPFSKGDKLGKVADWAVEGARDTRDYKRQQGQKGFRDPFYAYGASAASFFASEDVDNTLASFSLVESSSRSAPGSKTRPQNAVLRTRGRNARPNDNPNVIQGAFGGRRNQGIGGRGMFGGGGGGGPGSSLGGPGNASGNVGGGMGGGGGGSGGGPGGPGMGGMGGGPRMSGSSLSGNAAWKDYDKAHRAREPSVAIQPDWKLIQSIGFNELQKLSFDIKSKGEDLETHGHVYQYNKNFDKHTLSERLLPLDRVVYNVTASEDPVIAKFAQRNKGKVFVTDSMLSMLMLATKSVMPWDMVIRKRGSQIYFDKRDASPLDFVTVDENSVDPPVVSTDKDNINSVANLAFEATYVNQNFKATVLVETPQSTKTFDHPNPFHSTSGSNLLASAYKYRVFNLAANPDFEEPLELVVRTEVDAYINTPDKPLVSIKALNEYGANGFMEWKTKFNTQRGAIVAAEMKNNLCKISRWNVQSLLAGASVLKIGFVSRVSPTDNTKHLIAGVLTREPKQFASQINLNWLNAWGIVRSLVNIACDLDSGTYVLLRDPTLPALKLFSVPDNFEA